MQTIRCRVASALMALARLINPPRIVSVTMSPRYGV